MLTGSKNYPKNKGFESTQQWAAIIDEPSNTRLQTSTLKLPPVKPSPFSRLDRDNEGNFIGINQQGVQKKPQGTHSFVILPEAPNEVRIGEGHSAISQGQDVLFAGEITFKEESGKTIMAEWTNDSGHYATDSSTGHHTLYAVDSAGKPLFDSDKFAIRAQSKPMNFAPLPSQSLANSQTTMSTTNKLNPSAGVQGPTFPNFQTASSSSSTASSDWGARLGAVNAQFNKDKNSDTVSSSGQFQTFSYNTQRTQQPNLKEKTSIPTIQQNQSTTAATKEEATKTPRLGKH